MTDWIVRGVPAALASDGWWLTEAGEEPGRTGRKTAEVTGKQYRKGGGWLLLALVLLADVLFWGQTPGLSVALFGLILGGLVLWHRPLPVAQRGIGLAGLLQCLVPVVEVFQALSLLFWLAGLGWAVGIAAGPQGQLQAVWQRVLRFALGAGPQVGRDLLAAPKGMDRAATTRALMLWALPLSVGSLFALLLVAGNPLLDVMLQRLNLPEPQVGRALFWMLMAALVWPFLAIGAMSLDRPFARADRPTRLPPAFLNQGSVQRSLWLFNALFAVQTATDSAYLWGGAALPEGFSYAEYAHRGAYPLIVTALLAGLFAMVARPWASGLIRRLLLIWLGQNVALVISSIYRLDLYVDQFGLTHLRVAAFIWMGLVAIGLGLTLIQLIRNRSNGWLIRANAALLALVLFTTCFVNVDGVIARYNLDMGRDPDLAQRIDREYLCSLGFGALPAIASFEADHALTLCPFDGPALPQAGWRDWGFRAWRVQRYLEDQRGAAWQGRAF